MDGSAIEVPAGLAVLHADGALVVLDKPSGLLSVPAKPPGPQDCLLARVEAAWPGARLVHRLDRDTSGVMVFARSALAQRHLNWQFERRQVVKRYVARVAGEVVGEAGRIDLPLICDWPNRPLQMVCHRRGKPAVTDWEVIGREKGATRLRLRPLTGRSHQLRVHLQAMGHAILGDPFYAGGAALAAAERLQLHAESLGFRHPVGGAWVEFRAAVPFQAGVAEMAERTSVLARATGRVQGVGYRAWAQAEAGRLGLRGWVRNEGDGSVTALLAGPEAAVGEMLAAMRQGPRFAAVAEVSAEAVAPDGIPEGFEIRR